MKKIVIFVCCFICNPMFAGGLADALVNFAETGKSPECKDLKIKMLDLQKQLKDVETEYGSKCIIDGTAIQNDFKHDDSEPTKFKCDDGSFPDINGCCADEVYTDMGQEGFNCCPKSGGECFPPIKINK